MATITIGYLPELTPDRAMQTFAKHLEGAYEVQRASQRNRDFVLKKTHWAGVGVRLKQTQEKTTFVFTGTMPNAFLQGYVGGLASYLFLRSRWKQLETEVADFIATCPDFRPAQRFEDEPVQLITPAAAAAKAAQEDRAA